MDRREFLQEKRVRGLGIMALPFLKVPAFFKENRMGVVVHSYASRWRSKVKVSSILAFETQLRCWNIAIKSEQVASRL